MTSIIFEGPDGAGKSYTAEYISINTKIPVYHAGGPPATPEEAVFRAGKMLQLENQIFDRFPIISEQIYGPLLRGSNPFTIDDLKRLPHLVIYCRPSDETLKEVELITKSHKKTDHVQAVKSKYQQIIEKYDGLMEHVTHIKFNRDTHSCAELAGLLHRTILKDHYSCAE